MLIFTVAVKKLAIQLLMFIEAYSLVECEAMWLPPSLGLPEMLALIYRATLHHFFHTNHADSTDKACPNTVLQQDLDLRKNDFVQSHGLQP
jgi:hypothetical protein